MRRVDKIAEATRRKHGMQKEADQDGPGTSGESVGQAGLQTSSVEGTQVVNLTDGSVPKRCPAVVKQF